MILWNVDTMNQCHYLHQPAWSRYNVIFGFSSDAKSLSLDCTWADAFPVFLTSTSLFNAAPIGWEFDNAVRSPQLETSVLVLIDNVEDLANVILRLMPWELSRFDDKDPVEVTKREGLLRDMVGTWNPFVADAKRNKAFRLNLIFVTLIDKAENAVKCVMKTTDDSFNSLIRFCAVYFLIEATTYFCGRPSSPTYWQSKMVMLTLVKIRNLLGELVNWAWWRMQVITA